MKKIICLFIILFSFCLVVVYAADEPTYDPTYNNRAGAFYANGTEITIEEDVSGKAIIKWLGGSQIVPPSTTVFGGGGPGSNYDSSKITMNGGNVFCVVGGGLSKEESNVAIVGNANIVVNGGTVSGNVVGGGYLYSSVNTSNITINGGNIEAILGGGFATIMIDGQIYNSGTEAEAQNSGTRVNDVSITVNDVSMPPDEFSSGVIYGGGHGPAYVGNTVLTINGGSMKKGYITAGGSEGYVENAEVNIAGGDMYLYQSLNKGTVGNVTTIMTGGSIEKFFVGGESGDPSVTGAINQCEIFLVGGEITTQLSAGINNAAPLTLDNTQYKLVEIEDINITNDRVPPEQKTQVIYSLILNPTELVLREGENGVIDADLITEPIGYDYLLIGDIDWQSNSEAIATVSDVGQVFAERQGHTTITASFMNKVETATVTVEGVIPPVLVMTWVLPILVWFAIFILVFILLNQREN